MCPRSRLRGLLVFLFALTIIGVASAQLQTFAQSPSQTANSSSQAAPDQPATLRINTRLVVVDVIATSNKGAPVTDLKAGDFTIQEDGVEQPVQVFSFHQPGGEPPAQPGPFASPGKLPQGVFTNVPQYRTSGALNVVLLDALNSNLIDQAVMRDAMVKFLEKLPAGEPIAVYLLGSKLTLLQDFTSDPELLKKAVAGLKRQGSKTRTNVAGNTRDAQMPVGSVAAETIDSIPGLQSRLNEFRDQQNAAQTDVRVRTTLDVLNALARSLAGYAGRKNLIWISQTFPVSIVANRINSVNSRDYSAEIAHTGDLLSNAQVAIYPVDVRTLEGSSQFEVGADPNPMGRPQMEKQRVDGEAGIQVRPRE